MQEVFKATAIYLSMAVEAVAVVLIGLAAAHAAWRSAMLLIRREGSRQTERIRLRLGRWLVLALEFLVAADILRTAVAPAWEDIGKLAAIVVIRTVLDYFLQQEIQQTGTATEDRPQRG